MSKTRETLEMKVEKDLVRSVEKINQTQAIGTENIENIPKTNSAGPIVQTEPNKKKQNSGDLIGAWHSY